MSFDSQQRNRRFYLSIALEGKTLNVAPWGDVLSDGTVVLPLLVGMTSLVRSAGSLGDARIELPTLQVELTNNPDQSDTRTQDLLDEYEWGNRDVELIFGNGGDATTYTTTWKGKTQFPGGIGFNDARVIVRMVDVRSADARYLPTGFFSTDDYANMETKSINLPIPIVYGDWYSTAGQAACPIPAYQIDSTEGTGGRIKIACHALQSIEAVYLDGASASFTASSSDLDDGEFVLDEAYDPATETITVHCRGATEDGTSSGTLLQAAPAIFNDLYQTHLGVDAGNIASSALTDWDDYLDSNAYMRRWIGGVQTHSDDLTAQLLREGFADLTVEAGVYVPRYRVISPDGTATLVQAADILEEFEGGRKRFDVDQNPADIYANEVLGTYEYNPIDQAHEGLYLADDEVAIAEKGQRVRRDLPMYWIYITQGAEDRTNREVYVFSGELELVHLTMGPIVADHEPTDQIELVYSKFEVDDYEGVPFQLRDTETDPLSWEVTAIAWNLYRLSTGTWTDEAATTWLTATRQERFEKGFWSDADGYADTSGTPDDASRKYRWW